MNTNILQAIASNSPLSSIATQTQNLLSSRHRGRLIRINAVNSSGSSSNSGDRDAQQPVPTPITTPDTVEIRFRRGSRRRRQQTEDKKPMKAQASANTSTTAAPKKWEDMSLTEKAIELYVGEKGMLFWLNKFAYASIFITIGAWILFRFVGPSLNLYQLDAPPLSPSSVFKGS